MRFTSAALTTSALVLAAAAVGQQNIYPPGGPGFLRVSLADADEGEFTGCLADDGKWTVADKCTEAFGNGQGGLGTVSGWLILDDDSTITTVTTTWSTSWLGTHADGNRNASNLFTPTDDDDDGAPHGGPVWYAEAIPSGDDAVAVRGVKVNEGDVGISLFFHATLGE
ncbi:hypothetical protein P170DRAFT_95177 [Aspergillus steynii IBT 23096]|uniref:Uncharacterized protein n=1 Tax=Aspergillus steynii IBT 23096 TaxID=1392250 RepID=A0A2I2GGJ0_9EURO|nr:uncharacterized protein P170DRAFT_95177 [Aspergillus steynii IBT 23096]PLB52002.1 hypothetical protein P170DRAFT_95177 [Aspergillus steynii IBT 23096]